MADERSTAASAAADPTSPAGGLRVIGAGFGRTGTLSLKRALEQLGFGPCYHMLEVFAHPEHVPTWLAATRGEPVDWHPIFERFQATVDWPACSFYEQLMAAYPQAKVLLSVRDPQRWYDSAYDTIYSISRQGATGLQAVLRGAAFRLLKLVRPNIAAGSEMVNALVWRKTFGGRFGDRDYACSIFEEHIAEVKRRVPADRLLVYEVKQGWEPLCAFLGVPVPDTPFPHLNDRASWGRFGPARH